MTLKAEISGDPLGRGYSGMTDKQIIDSLLTVDRPRNRSAMTGDELFSATDATEYGALTEAQRLLWVSFCGRDVIDPFGSANVAFVTDLFGAGSDTLSTLAGARSELISRAAELGLPKMTPTDVATDRK